MNDNNEETNDVVAAPPNAPEPTEREATTPSEGTASTSAQETTSAAPPENNDDAPATPTNSKQPAGRRSSRKRKQVEFFKPEEAVVAEEEQQKAIADASKPKKTSNKPPAAGDSEEQPVESQSDGEDQDDQEEESPLVVTFSRPSTRVNRHLYELCEAQSQEYKSQFRQLVWAKLSSFPWSPAIVTPPYLTCPSKIKKAAREMMVGGEPNGHIVLWLGSQKIFSKVDLKHIKPFSEENLALYEKGVIGGKKKMTANAKKLLADAIEEAKKVKSGDLVLLEDEATFVENLMAIHVKNGKASTPKSKASTPKAKRTTTPKEPVVVEEPGVKRKRAQDKIRAFIEELPLTLHVPPVAKKLKKKRKKDRKEKKEKKKHKHKKRDKEKRKSLTEEADMEEDDQSQNEETATKKRKETTIKTESQAKRPKTEKATTTTNTVRIPENESVADRLRRLGMLLEAFARKGEKFNKRKVMKNLAKLADVQVTADLVGDTNIGLVVGNLMKHEDREIGKLAKGVRKIWMKQLNSSTSTAVQQTPPAATGTAANAGDKTTEVAKEPPSAETKATGEEKGETPSSNVGALDEKTVKGLSDLFTHSCGLARSATQTKHDELQAKVAKLEEGAAPVGADLTKEMDKLKGALLDYTPMRADKLAKQFVNELSESCARDEVKARAKGLLAQMAKDDYQVHHELMSGRLTMKDLVAKK